MSPSLEFGTELLIRIVYKCFNSSVLSKSIHTADMYAEVVLQAVEFGF